MQLKVQELTGGAIDTLWCLFRNGPTWDGHVPSKAGRNQLVELDLAERGEGYQWLTRAGVEAAIAFKFHDKKERETR